MRDGVVRIEKSMTVLTGFNGESSIVVGQIKLHVIVAGENKMTTFLVLDYPSTYKIILVYCGSMP